ncbi:MAG: FtsX-like permease family protein [Propionibacteriaceae bacterium]
MKRRQPKVSPGGRLPLAARLALRDALCHKWRSALILTLIMLPVLAMTSLSTWYVSTIATPAELAQATLGDTVAARVHHGYAPCIQNPLDEQMCFSADSGMKPIDQKNIKPLSDVLSDDYDIHWIKKTELYWESPLLQGYLSYRLNTYSGAALQPPLASAFPIIEGEMPCGDEIAIDRSIVKETGATIGMSFRLSGKDYRISAIVGSETLYNPIIFLSPQTPMPKSDAIEELASSDSEVAYLVGPPLSWEALVELNKEGWGGYSRAVLDNPPTGLSVNTDLSTMHMQRSVVIGGIGIAAVIAICGTAFSITAKNQRRSVGLMAAVGAEASFMRKVMVWNGLWLGGLGSLVGVILGIPFGWAISVFLDARYSGIHWGHHLNIKLTVFAFLLGIAAAVIAALIPTRELRKMDALAVMRTASVPSSKARFPLWGLASTILGAIFLVAPRFLVYVTGYDIRNGSYDSITPSLSVGMIVAGSLLLSVGALLTLGWVIRLASEIWSPLPLRLSLRDSSRNRGRTITAIAATMAATVLASLVVVMQEASLNDQQRINAALGSPTANVIEVSVADRWKNISPDIDIEKLRKSVSEYVPVAAAEKLQLVNVNIEVPKDNYCNKSVRDPQYRLDWRCSRSGNGHYLNPAVIAGGAQLAFLLGREPSQAERTAYKQGQGLALDKSVEISGRCYLSRRFPKDVISLTPEELDNDRFIMPCLLVENDLKYYYAPFIVSDKAAEAAGIEKTKDSRVVIVLEHDLEWKELSEIIAAINKEIPYSDIKHARILSPIERTAGWLLTVLAMGFVLLVTATTTALVIVDSRSDEATFAAVGAGSRFRKQMAASQVVVTATLGVVLGTALTIAVSLAVAEASILVQEGTSIKIPWAQLLTLIVATPIVGGLVAWVVTPSQLTMIRRLE